MYLIFIVSKKNARQQLPDNLATRMASCRCFGYQKEKNTFLENPSLFFHFKKNTLFCNDFYEDRIMDIKDIKFSQNLFWDVDEEELDMEKHKEFIVERVLDYGFMNDWLVIKNYYSLENLALIAKNIRCLMPKSLAFIAAITDTQITDYRCYKSAQSNPPHWNY